MNWVFELGHEMWLGSRRAPAGEVLYANATVDSAPLQPVQLQSSALPPPPAGSLRFVCLSDTHERHASVDVPPGDVLLLAGDLLAINRHFSTSFSRRKLRGIAAWLGGLGGGAAAAGGSDNDAGGGVGGGGGGGRFRYGKFFIGGNHDAVLERLGAPAVREIFGGGSGGGGASYLEDSGATIAVAAAGNDGEAGDAGDGGAEEAGAIASGAAALLRVWGSPTSRGSSANDAFQSRPEERVAAIPTGLGVLLTHGPLPAPVLRELRPRLHVSGHVHERHGVRRVGGTVCVNASIMDGSYHPRQVPVVVDMRVAAC
jgi:hypothetical protein